MVETGELEDSVEGETGKKKARVIHGNRVSGNQAVCLLGYMD